MSDKTVSEQIDDIINLHGGWKSVVLSRLRNIVTATDSAVFEEVKWKMPTRPEGLPVWSYDGIVCFAEIWKDNIKLIFMHGSQLQDEHKLFNARLKSESVRAIEMREGDSLNQAAFSQLVIEAIDLQKSRVK